MKQWARKWGCCQECGQTDKAHKGHGLCARCYDHKRWFEPQLYCADCGVKIGPNAIYCCTCESQRRWALGWARCRECGTTEVPHTAHGLCGHCYCRKWRKDHPEEKRAYAKKWEEEHREERREYGLKNRRKWYQNNREYMQAYYREWYKNNRDRHNVYVRRWYENNKDKNREKSRRYRARKLGVTVLPVDEQKIYELYNRACLYCGSKEDLGLDHVIPLSTGGVHCEDNLVVSCRSCNSSKGSSSLEAYLERRPTSRCWVM